MVVHDDVTRGYVAVTTVSNICFGLIDSGLGLLVHFSKDSQRPKILGIVLLVILVAANVRHVSLI